MRYRASFFLLSALVATAWVVIAGPAALAAGACVDEFADVNGDGEVSVLDVQCGVLALLTQLTGGEVVGCVGAQPNGADADCSGVVTVADISVVAAMALGLELPVVIDANANGCPDACFAVFGCTVGDCTDSGLCFVSECDPLSGGCVVVATNEGVPCDDGNACTDLDQCTSGQCAGEVSWVNLAQIDDGNPCTDDWCHSLVGGVNSPNFDSCFQEGDPCNDSGQCVGGVCVSTVELGDSCTASDPCVSSVCTAEGCIESTVACDPSQPPGMEFSAKPYSFFGSNQSSSERSLLAGDFDADGDADMVLIRDGKEGLSLLRGEPGTEAEVALEYWEFPGTPFYGGAVGKLNADDTPDVVVHSKHALFGLFSGDVPLEELPLAIVAERSFSAVGDPVLVDMNVDGAVDIVWDHGLESAVDVFINSGSGDTWTKELVDTKYRADELLVGDVNGDGHDDAIALWKQEGVTRVSTVMANTDETGAFATTSAVITGPSASTHFRAADVDGDGDVDLVAGVGVGNSGWTTIGPGGLDWYENAAGDGTEWTPYVLADYPATAIATAELNGDGRVDLIVSDRVGRGVVLLSDPSEGPAEFTVQLLPDIVRTVDSIVSTDLEGDGDTDFVFVPVYVDPNTSSDTGSESVTYGYSGHHFPIVRYRQDSVDSTCCE